MRRTVILSLILFSAFWLTCSESWGSLAVSGSPSSTIVPGGVTTAIPVTIKLANISAGSDEVAVWQVGLNVVPTAGSAGAVKMTAFSQPADYVLNGQTLGGPALVFGATLPNASAVFSDVSTGLSGGVIPAAGSRNLLQLTVTVPAGATGSFRLEMTPFDASPDVASMWMGPNSLGLEAFENAGAGASSVQRTLLTITIQQVPEPASLSQGALATTLLALAANHIKYFRRGPCAKKVFPEVFSR